MLLRGGVDLNGRFCTATACFILKALFGDEDEERVLRVLGGDRDDIGLASIALLRRRSVDFPRFRVAGGTPSERIVLVRTSAEAVGCDRSLGVVRCARGESGGCRISFPGLVCLSALSGRAHWREPFGVTKGVSIHVPSPRLPVREDEWRVLDPEGPATGCKGGKFRRRWGVLGSSLALLRWREDLCRPKSECASCRGKGERVDGPATCVSTLSRGPVVCEPTLRTSRVVR